MTNEFEIIQIKQGDIDSLTGVLRKDRLENRIGKSIELYNRGECSIILFDVDYFKAVNDLFGHNQGDSILKDMGAILQSFNSEIVAYAGVYGRWGGEEFLIALPYAKSKNASEIAESIRKSVENYDFYDTRTGRTLEQRITITLGIQTEDFKKIKKLAKEQGAKEAIKSLVAKADTALSYGKFLGKNRMEIFSQYIKGEIKNLGVVRRFYFDLANRDEKYTKDRVYQSKTFKTHTKIKNAIRKHMAIIKEEVSLRDTRTQAIFADNLYREIRKLDCDDKKEIIYSMKQYLKK